MYSFSGSVNGNSIKTKESLQAFEGCSVIVTILDDMLESSVQQTQSMLDSKRKAAAREIAGMWKSHSADDSVEEMVRDLRKERHLDI